MPRGSQQKTDRREAKDQVKKTKAHSLSHGSTTAFKQEQEEYEAYQDWIQRQRVIDAIEETMLSIIEKLALGQPVELAGLANQTTVTSRLSKKDNAIQQVEREKKIN